MRAQIAWAFRHVRFQPKYGDALVARFLYGMTDEEIALLFNSDAYGNYYGYREGVHTPGGVRDTESVRTFLDEACDNFHVIPSAKASTEPIE